MNLEELTERVETLEATRVAFLVVLAALIRHQPDYDRTQLFLTAHLEQQLTRGGLGRSLTPEQLHYAREIVEWLQTIKSADDPNIPKTRGWPGGGATR